jgi:hypothetical protein
MLKRQCDYLIVVSQDGDLQLTQPSRKKNKPNNQSSEPPYSRKDAYTWTKLFRIRKQDLEDVPLRP